MPILQTDIKFMQSGTANLGGAISVSEVSSVLHGLFDVVSGQESLDGDVEYRCVYVKNAHATLTLYNARVYIDKNTPSASTSCDIGLGVSGIGGVEPAIDDEGTAPVDVGFSAPMTFVDGLPIGDLRAGQHRAVWIRRTVSPGAAAFNSDCVWIAVDGDTGA